MPLPDTLAEYFFMNHGLSLQQVDIGFKSRGEVLSESKFLADLSKEAQGGIKLRKALIFA